MTAAEVLVVLPTLGDRIESLALTLESVRQQRDDVALTLVVITPVGATIARDLATRFGAVVVDDPRTGISEAIKKVAWLRGYRIVEAGYVRPEQ